MADATPLDPITLTEMRLRALELAEKTVAQVYVSNANGMGGSHRDKDMSEIALRAERILRFALDTEIETQSGLIEKLRTALCQKQ